MLLAMNFEMTDRKNRKRWKQWKQTKKWPKAVLRAAADFVRQLKMGNDHYCPNRVLFSEG